MDVKRMKALVRAVRECGLDSWELWRKLPLVRHGYPNPVLMAYASRFDLQDEYTCVFDAKNAVVNRVDGAPKWKLHDHFGISQETVGQVFGTGGCGSSTTPEGCAIYLEGMVSAYEEAIEDLVLRGQSYAANVVAGTTPARNKVKSEVTEPQFPFPVYEDPFEDSLPDEPSYDEVAPEYLDTREEAEVTPTPVLKRK